MSALSSLPQFDPRAVPVQAVDAHLPALRRSELEPAALRRRFAQPTAWQPEVRAEARFPGRTLQHAAVLIPIVQRDDPTVLLTQRTSHLSTHSGQIAFPGGKVDAGDVSPAATALREAWEEVGLEARYVEILGEMPHYLTGTAFSVTPVVALVQPGFTLSPNAHEVADVFEVPLPFLMDPAHHRRHSVHWQGVQREWFSMPWSEPLDEDQSRERFIWGATAGMLRNLYRMLSAPQAQSL